MPDQTALVVREEPKALTLIQQALDARIEAIAEVLPPNMDPKRFVRTAILAVSKNPDLLGCSPSSVVTAIVEAAEVGLEPTGSLSRAWLVPFREKDKARPDAKLIIGYQGYADLMRDTGRISQVWAEVVYEGDDFEEVKGDAPKLTHVPRHVTEDPTKALYVYACARFVDGHVQSHVMTRSQVEAIRAKARSKNSPAWVGSWPAMARKTALRQLANYVPLSTKAQGAIERDDEREYGAPAEPTPSRTEEVKARIRRKVGAPDAPGAPEKPEVAVDATEHPVVTPDPQGEAVEGQATEVCGAQSDPNLGDVETCNLVPLHGGKVHRSVERGADGDTLRASWPA